MATTIAAPVYGRLGDALGRKRLLFVALFTLFAGGPWWPPPPAPCPAGENMRATGPSPPRPMEKTGISERRAYSFSWENETALDVSTPSLTSTTALLSAGPLARRRMDSKAAS